jgi:hypothetical protein
MQAVADSITTPNGQTITKACCFCGQIRPLSEFRRARAGTEFRRAECRQCHATIERERSAARRQKELQQFLRNLTRTRQLGNAIALVTDVVARLGGAKHVARLWHERIEKAPLEQSLSAMRSLISLSALVEHQGDMWQRRRERNERQEREQKEAREQQMLDDMSDAELAAYAEHLRQQEGISEAEFQQLMQSVEWEPD